MLPAILCVDYQVSCSASKQLKTVLILLQLNCFISDLP